MLRSLAALLTVTAAAPLFAQLPTPDLKRQVEALRPTLDATYLELHRAPELSRQEVKTSAFLSGELKKLGYTVTDHIGHYEDGSQALGLVGVLKNGAGPTILIRTDMDALPVTEGTGLPYASKVHATNAQGQDVGVMHACGHDTHMSVFLGVAKILASNRGAWHGTVEMLAQPAEEVIAGAKAMMADHLYDRIPRPVAVLDMHDTNNYATGTVATAAGPLLASSTSVYITFHGIGAHGSTPANGKDPILMGAEFVVLAQAIVSRQIPAQNPAVLTVGTFHAGTKNNIIPDDATLGLTLRAYDEPTRKTLVEGVTRTANAVATAYNVAADKMPTITIPEQTVPTVNDATLAAQLRETTVATLGADRVVTATPIMGSEDVPFLTDDGKVPLAMFWLGVADPAALAESHRTGKPLPNIHSPLFAPVYEPALTTGVETMAAFAMKLLQ